MILSDSFNVKVTHVEGAGTAQVDTIDAHEGMGDGLAAVGEDWVAHGLGNHLDTHAGFDADAVSILHLLGGNDKSGHSLISG